MPAHVHYRQPVHLAHHAAFGVDAQVAALDVLEHPILEHPRAVLLLLQRLVHVLLGDQLGARLPRPVARLRQQVDERGDMRR